MILYLTNAKKERLVNIIIVFLSPFPKAIFNLKKMIFFLKLNSAFRPCFMKYGSINNKKKLFLQTNSSNELKKKRLFYTHDTSYMALIFAIDAIILHKFWLIE